MIEEDFSVPFADRLRCTCDHILEEHIVVSHDETTHTSCTGEWSDQSMPIPCCCTSYRETTLQREWDKADAEREQRYEQQRLEREAKEKTSLWYKIKQLFQWKTR